MLHVLVSVPVAVQVAAVPDCTQSCAFGFMATSTAPHDVQVWGVVQLAAAPGVWVCVFSPSSQAANVKMSEIIVIAVIKKSGLFSGIARGGGGVQ
jgi:hypothetical protein